MKRSLLLWAVALLVMLSAAGYQRMTGPTHPLRVRTELSGQEIQGRLIRSQTIDVPVPVSLKAAERLNGYLKWRRWPGDHPWHTVPLQRDGERLVGALPPQSVTAARIEFEVHITDDQGARLTIPARLRFKGPVPTAVLVVHVVAMFLGMLLSLRAGLEALTRGSRQLKLAIMAVVCLGVGGLVFGPVVQKYAFDAYWTGWPVGEDLTDNKTALAVLVWLVAVWQLRRGRRWWAVGASAVTLAVYLIPHSLHGSTHDWETGRHIQAMLASFE